LDGGGFGVVQSGRLFAEDVLTGLERGYGLWGVESYRRGYVDCGRVRFAEGGWEICPRLGVIGFGFFRIARDYACELASWFG
jgi:hypothetical protein